MKHLKRKSLARVLGGTNGTRKSVTRKKAARYKRPKSGVVSTSLTPKELKQVATLCKKWHLNMSEAIRILVRIGLKDTPEWSRPSRVLGGLGIFR